MQDFEVKERLREHLEYLCSLDKLSGEPEAYRAVEYILEVLEKSGISCHEEDFPAYLSNPVSSVLIADGEEFPCRPRSFAESTKGRIEIPLIYDPGTKTEVSQFVRYCLQPYPPDSHSRLFHPHRQSYIKLFQQKGGCVRHPPSSNSILST